MDENRSVAPDAKRILVKARALIEQPNGWVKGNWARINQDGPHIFPSDNAFLSANCFCLHGAIYRAAFDLGLQRGSEPIFAAEDAAIAVVAKRTGNEQYDFPDMTIMHNFNDLPTTTVKDILAVLDDAIAGIVVPA